ncbi:MAG: glycosyltransferase family 4 protein [Planctomycetes bacterium]|nr:glycosyltransferase family 4 protein [Planctomycetota bacterium]
MRVLYLTDSLSDLDGVGRYAVRLISALQELEPALEPHVLLARKHRPTSEAVPASWKVEVALPPDYLFYMTPLRFWANSALAIARAARAARSCDLVHAIKDYPHNWIALRAAEIAGKPCIATAHGTYSVQPLQDPRHSARARAAYGRFQAMISVSSFTAGRMQALLTPKELPRSRLHVVPNAVDADHFLARRAIGPRPWHGQDFSLAIGELKERKGHHLSLAAFARVAPSFPTLQHYLVGKLSGDAYEASLRAIVAEAGLSERVHFLGNVSEDEKVDLQQRARVFLHTPVDAADGGFEGFGLVYLEAAACGLPSIGTRESGAADAIRDGETGLLVESNVESVAAGLERVLADVTLASHLAGGGHAFARASNWTENAERVLELYRAALK